MRSIIRWIHKTYLNWKFRKVDPEICCCGEMYGTGGSICAHGGCRSAKEYAITCSLAKYKLGEWE